jgi:methylated-DNA-[protein]-cysteine S-methyltransferase
VQLPEASESATRSRLRARCPAATESSAPEAVQRAIDAVVALLDGQLSPLTFVQLDLAGIGDFERRACEFVRSIPPGKTTTYGAVAAALDQPGAARAVGQAMGNNPCPVIVPCHRVLATDGSLGGFSAAGGANTKHRLLALAGAEAVRQADLFQPQDR